MRRIRAADDFESIRLRLEELRRQRENADERTKAEQKREDETTSLPYGGRRLPLSPRRSSR